MLVADVVPIGGVFNVLVNKDYPDSTGYLIADRFNELKGEYAKVEWGTVFFVCHGENSEVYAITARHCLPNDPLIRCFYIRVNHQGWIEDIPAPLDYWHWNIPVASDVAVALIHDKRVPAGFPSRDFVSQERAAKLLPGLDTFTVSLFLAGDGLQKIEPLVRFGKLCRANLALELEDKTPVIGHLIQGHVWDTESGPVFTHEQYHLQPPSLGLFMDAWGSGDPGGLVPSHIEATSALTPLLGLVHGHFKADGQNSGIGVVIPAKDILATLNLPLFENDRAQRFRERARQRPHPC